MSIHPLTLRDDHPHCTFMGAGENGSSSRAGIVLVAACFLLLALLNLLVMVQANQVAFSQNQQPYDFYVLLHASSQVFSAPSQVYLHQNTSSLPSYWGKWLWYGASYLYTPMFAVLISPLSSLYPPDARILWESLSYVLLLTACFAVLKIVHSTKLRLFLILMIFIMPFQIIYTNQTLPQFWLPQMSGMWISPVFFTDYYWGNTNTAALAIGLLSYYFALRRETVDLRVVRIPPYVLGALLLALDTFKVTVALLIIPFWLVMSRKKILPSLGFLMVFIVILNSVVLFEPALLTGYFSALFSEPQAALWQVYEYVWYYTLPTVGIILIWQNNKEQAGRGPTLAAHPGLGPGEPDHGLGPERRRFLGR